MLKSELKYTKEHQLWRKYIRNRDPVTFKHAV